MKYNAQGSVNLGGAHGVAAEQILCVSQRGVKKSANLIYH